MGTKEQLQPPGPRIHGYVGGSEGRRRLWGFTSLLEAPVPLTLPHGFPPQDKGGCGNGMALEVIQPRKTLLSTFVRASSPGGFKLLDPALAT